MDKIALFHVMGRQVYVRAIGDPCGGSYGSKFMSWQVQSYAALLSRATGKPVKLIFTKEEHLAAFTIRPASHMTARLDMKRDGTVTAISGTWLIGYRLLLHDQLIPSGSRLWRGSNHSPMGQLEFETNHFLHQPERFWDCPRLWSSEAKMYTHPHLEPCHREAGDRSVPVS